MSRCSIPPTLADAVVALAALAHDILQGISQNHGADNLPVSQISHFAEERMFLMTSRR